MISLDLICPTWHTVTFVGNSQFKVFSNPTFNIINSVWIKGWRQRRTWIYLFGFTLMKHNFRCCVNFTEVVLYLGITNHKTWILSRNLKFHSGWCQTRLMEFKSINARGQFLQVLNKSQLVDLGIGVSTPTKATNLGDPFLRKIKGSMDWLRIHLHSKLSSSYPALPISIWFGAAKVGGCARKKYWFQRLAWKQGWCHGSFIHSGPLLSEGLQENTLKCYKRLTRGITELQPTCNT